MMVDEEGEMRIRGVMNWVQAHVSEEGVFQQSLVCSFYNARNGIHFIDVAQISMIVVEPGFHGRGIATALIDYAQETTLDTYTRSLPDRTKSDGRVIMTASCLADSVPAKHVFEKKGFIAVDGEVQEMLKEKVVMMEWKAPDVLPPIADDL
jgi:GNAT superfamily N-acetyltransferase